MANLSIVTEPTNINPVYNYIKTVIRTTNLFTGSDALALLEIQFNNDGSSIVDETIIISFLNYDLEFTFVSGTVDESGYELPINTGSQTEAQFVASVSSALNNNYLLTRYFSVNVKSGDTDCIQIQAKNVGSDYNLTLSGSALANLKISQQANTAGSKESENTFYKIALQLYENDLDAAYGEEISLPPIYDGTNADAEFDLSEIVQTIYSKLFFAFFTDSRFAKFDNYMKVFWYYCTEIYGADENSAYRKNLESHGFYVIPAKLSQGQLINNTVQAGTFFSSNSILSFHPYANAQTGGYKIIGKDAFTQLPELINFFNYNANVGIRFKIFFVDTEGTETLAIDSQQVTIAQYDMVLFGFPEWSDVLIGAQNAWNDTQIVRVKIYDNGDSLINTIDYLVDEKNHLNEEYLLFKNEFGVFEKIRLTGESIVIQEYDRMQVFQEEEGFQFAYQDIDKIVKKKINSGNRFSLAELEYYYNSLMTSDFVFIYDDGNYFPVLVTDKKQDYTKQQFESENAFDVNLIQFYVNQTVIEELFAESTELAFFTVTFQITEAGTGANLEGATINIAGESLMTDANGQASISLQNGSYSYNVSKTDHQPTNGTLIVSGSNKTENASIYQYWDVTFTVTGSDVGNLQGAQILLNGQYKTTDVNGNATFNNLINGNYSYSITKSGYKTINSSVTISNADEAPSAEMQKYWQTIFNVKDYDDEFNIEGAKLSINGNTRTTNASGNAYIDLIDGSYPYTIEKDHYDDTTGIAIVNNSTQTINETLETTKLLVRFHVTDSDNSGADLQGATVTVGGQQEVTDVNGNADFNLADGNGYEYSVAKTGYDTVNGTVLLEGSPITKEVSMELTEYLITFNVKDLDDGFNINGANIAINSQNLTTNTSGNATILLKNGSYPYTISKQYYDDTTGTLVVNSSEQQVNKTLETTKLLVRFHVTDSDNSGADLQGATVTCDGQQVVTDASGNADFNLADGEGYEYSVAKTGYDTVNGTVLLEGSPITKEVSMELTEYLITFNVKDLDDGFNINGANIAINSQNLTTNTSGNATILLKNGSYPYTISKQYYDDTTGTLVVNSSEQQVNKTLETTKILVRFHVTDSDNSGADLQGATVTCDGQQVVTNASGNADFHLADGEGYEYSVAKTGYDTVNGTVLLEGSLITKEVSMELTEYLITFNVKDLDDGFNINGANIAINSQNLTTNTSGNATILLKNGSYPYTISKQYYDDTTGTLIVSSAEKTENKTLETTKYTVKFKVTDNDNGGANIEGATVTVDGGNHVTNSNGEVSVQLADGQGYNYTVSKSLYSNETGNVLISGSGFTENVGMDRSHFTCTFHVTDSSSSANIAGAIIDINYQQLETNGSGIATINLARDTYYNYTVNATNYDEETGTVNMTQDLTENVSMTQR